MESQECEQQLNGALTSLKTAAESLKEAERVVSLGCIPVRCRIPEIVYSKSKDVGGVLCSILQSVSAILLQKSYGHIFRSLLCLEKLLKLILLGLDPLTFVNQKSLHLCRSYGLSSGDKMSQAIAADRAGTCAETHGILASNLTPT